MKRFRIVQSYVGQREMVISAQTEEEAIKLFNEIDTIDREDDPEGYISGVIELERDTCSVVETEDLKERFESACAGYRLLHGQSPRFAEVNVRFKGAIDEVKNEIVCFDPSMDIQDTGMDDVVLFHYNGENPIEDMFSDKEDFVITEIEDVFYEL